MRKRMKAFVCILAVAIVAGILLELFLSQLFGGWDFGFLPSGSYMSNPLEKVPDLNPVSRINPFSGIYKNPFG